MLGKRGFSLVLAVFLLVVLYFNSVSAACTNANQRIMKLSADTNAHGEVWDGALYPYEICYNDIFDGQIYAGTNPHNPENRVVLSLSSATNAHATGPDGSYTTKVFYGDLVCALRENSCSPGEKIVVSLSEQSNAHLGAGDKYKYKICCSAPLTYWANYNGEKITLAGIGWTVKLVYESTSLTDGEDVNFKVYEHDFASNDNIITLGAKAVGGKAIAEWNISWADIDDGGCDNQGGNDCDEFFFLVNGREERKSSYLGINKTAINTKPISSINGPKHRGIYYTGKAISFSHNSTDIEGPLSVEWNIGDLLIEKNKHSFEHTYNSHGQKVIKLKVRDSGGMEDESQISILVISSPGIFSFIGKPRTNEAIVSRELMVDYDGSDSYVVNSVSSGSSGSCTTTVTCEGGNCPEKTESTPVCSSSNEPINIGGIRGNFANMLYKWVFLDGQQSSELQANGKIDGKKGYSSQGNKVISLSISANSMNSETFSVPFTLYDQRQCSLSGAEWVNIENGREIARYNTMNSDNCKGKDGVIGSDDDCCPTGFHCTNIGCQIGDITKLAQCSDYLDSISCDKDVLKAVKNNPLWQIRGCGLSVAGNNVICACNWRNNKCEFGVSIRNSDNPLGLFSKCSYQTELGECSNGYQDVDIIATLIEGSDSSCTTKKEVALCGRPAIQLPFFAGAQILVSLLIVGIVYLALFYGINKKE